MCMQYMMSLYIYSHSIFRSWGGPYNFPDFQSLTRQELVHPVFSTLVKAEIKQAGEDENHIFM